MSHFNIDVDAAAVLGVPPSASLQEIRDAYRAKAKRYHPDSGGEEWAFRILVQSYELMSTARVMQASAREAAAPPRSPRPAGHGHAHARASSPPPPPNDHAHHRRPEHDAARTTARPGVHDTGAHPTRVVEIERLAIRYEPEHVWLITDRTRDDRFVSCCLNLSWPGPTVEGPPSAIPDAEKTLVDLAAVFDDVAKESRAQSARSEVSDGRFGGWLSYPSTSDANAAFQKLRQKLRAANLVVNQVNRDMVIPRHRH